MPGKAILTGDSKAAVPGTSNQTGNSAPKWPWKYVPEGRVARIAVLCIARYLGFQDYEMAVDHVLPPEVRVYALFIDLFPWFPAMYDADQIDRAAQIGYTGPLNKFGPPKPHNRLRYNFAKPGRHGADPKKRVYGYSDEYPLSAAQQLPGGLMEVYLRCSKILDDRLKSRQPVSREEAQQWGTLSGNPVGEEQGDEG